MQILCQLKQARGGIAKDALVPPANLGDSTRLKLILPVLNKSQQILDAIVGQSFNLVVDDMTYACALHQESAYPIRIWYDEQTLMEIIVEVYGVASMDSLLAAKTYKLDL